MIAAEMPVITLLTDYGMRDSYVAEVKGAILRIAPDVTIIDISHDNANYDIEEGAFHLARSVPYFPEGTIHVGVVDPGVGGGRRSIVIEACGALLVGPDNGLLAPAAERLGVERVYEITNRDMLPPRVSDVFDGRDIFGPAAAHLAMGVAPSALGGEASGYVRLPQYTPVVSGGRVEARIIHVDGFGNLVTNVTADLLGGIGAKEGSMVHLKARGLDRSVPYIRRFSAVPRDHLLLLVAGGGYLEISVNRGSARGLLGLERGEAITLDFA